jgi:IS30 family transposase
MPRACSICTHEKRDEIEAAIANGTSYRVIARQFSTGHDAIQRHAASHIKESVNHSQEAKEEARGLDVVRQLKTINTVTLAILQKARNEKDKEWLALQAIDRVCKQLELQAKLLGDVSIQQDENVDPSLAPYMTGEDIATIKNIIQRAKLRKDEEEGKVIPIRKRS